MTTAIKHLEDMRAKAQLGGGAERIQKQQKAYKLMKQHNK